MAYFVDVGAGVRQIAEDYDTPVSVLIATETGPATASSATLTLYRPVGTKVLDAVSATVSTAGQVSYTYQTADLSGETHGAYYTEEWAITISGVVVYARRTAAVVRRSTLAPITEESLYAVEPRLRDAVPRGQANWSPQLSEAWTQVLLQLQQSGSQPWTATGIDQLRGVALYHALTLILEILSEGDAGSRWGARLEAARARLVEEWRRLEIDTDSDDDGVPDTSGDSLERYSATADPTGGPALAAGRGW